MTRAIKFVVILTLFSQASWATKVMATPKSPNSVSTSKVSRLVGAQQQGESRCDQMKRCCEISRGRYTYESEPVDLQDPPIRKEVCTCEFDGDIPADYERCDPTPKPNLGPSLAHGGELKKW